MFECGCRLGIEKYSFGTATIHHDLADRNTCYVLNGQQRLITCTILLAVLRHLISTRFPDTRQTLLSPDLFNFSQGRAMHSVSRIQVRKLQSEFWTRYLSPAEDNLGCLWNEDGQLRLELADSDTITCSFMQAADVIKKVHL